MVGIRIDNLTASLTPSLDYEFPAMKSGVTEKLTVQQVADLVLAIVVDGADPSLDTLNELANALSNRLRADAVQSFSSGQKLQLLENIGLDLIGFMFDYGGDVPPNGFIWANGQNRSRTVDSLLFAKYGTTYGPGDGSTTFSVPDTRGRVIAGKDDMGGVSADRLTGLSGGVNGDVLGSVGGSEQHLLTLSEMPNHAHSQLADFTSSGTNGLYPAAGGNGGTVNQADTGATGGGLAHNNIQPTLIQNKIIFTGVFS